MLNLLAHIAGLDNASGSWYLFWSGIFGDAGYIGVPLILLRRYNCHQPRCWRLGKHPHGNYTYCRVHHPEVE